MRLIDADAIPYCEYDLDNYHSFRAVEDTVIDEMPTIDPVKHGKWEFNKIDKHGNRKPECSICGKYSLAHWSDHAKCNYCPNCGARMDGE